MYYKHGEMNNSIKVELFFQHSTFQLQNVLCSHLKAKIGDKPHSVLQNKL